MILLGLAIILNDLTKIFQLSYDIAKDLLEERRMLREKKRREERVKKIRQVILDMDEDYSRDLEQRLAHIHLKLLKACARRRACDRKMANVFKAK